MNTENASNKIAELFLETNTYDREAILNAMIASYNMGYSDASTSAIKILGSNMQQLKEKLEIK